jgi:regulator of sigma E protease
MSDQENAPVEKKETNKFFRLFILALLVGGAIYFTKHLGQAWNIILVLAGFGAVIFVHELGHFIAAKSVGIKVEGFALGFGPTLLSFQTVDGGFQIRILPGLFHEEDGKGHYHITIPTKSTRQAETEYKINLVPLGGYVKMLGQEDAGPDKPSDDPRAFGNKKVWQRAIVVSAGVIMNIISGILVFMIVFSHGVDLEPAVIGDVAKDMPAAKAGLKPGDEVIEIDGKKKIVFTDIMLASALADKKQGVEMKVKHPDGNLDNYTIVPEMNKQLGIQGLGIRPAQSLTIGNVRETKVIEQLRQLGLQAGDTITAVNGQEISRADQLNAQLYPETLAPPPANVKITVARKTNSGEMTEHEIEIPFLLAAQGEDRKIVGQILGMKPRLKVEEVTADSAKAAGLQAGDVILQIGSIQNPTLEEIYELSKSNISKPVQMVVGRQLEGNWTETTLEVTPYTAPVSWFKRIFGDEGDPMIGFAPAFDLDHPIISKVNKDAFPAGAAALSIPRGSQIVTIEDVPVANWREIIRELVKHPVGAVDIGYQVGDQAAVDIVTIDVSDKKSSEWIYFSYMPDLKGLLDLPLPTLVRQFKGENWSESLELGLDRTYVFVAQTYLMIKGMFQGTMSVKAASGPVGILSASYMIVQERPASYYFYFLAIISVCVAVFNFLPLPVLDGGLMVFLLIEKIKGSPISLRTQEIATYAGLVLILGLVLWVTVNDIGKIIGM